MTPLELRGLYRGGILLFLLGVLRVGWDRQRVPEDPLDAAPDESSVLMAASREAKEEGEERSRPLAPGETVDPNRAGEVALDRLPGVGPSVARAIVEHRTRNGGFSRPDDLLAVRGIGPATLEKIRERLDFAQGVPLELRGIRGGGSSVTGTGRGRDPTPEGSPALTGSPAVNVNTATAEELESLPGIGPVLARRILENRQAEGAFRQAEDLLRVPGIGPVVLGRIRNRITLRR